MFPITCFIIHRQRAGSSYYRRRTAEVSSVYAVNAGLNPPPAKGAQVENTVDRGLYLARP